MRRGLHPGVRSFLAAASVIAVGCCAGAAVAVGDAQEQARIAGGREVKSLAENPGVVGLHVKVSDPSNGGMVCGATRIAPDWVLTAKHCVGGKYEFTAVTSHTVRRSEGPRVPIEKVIPHPKNVDLAAVKLATINGPGPIATWTDTPMKPGQALRIFGWGYTKPLPSPSLILKTAAGTVHRHSKNPIKGPTGDFTDGMDVVYRSTEGLCWTGDSGGPLFNADGQLVGVSSWSNGFGNTTQGECGYTSLQHEGSWVKEVTGIAPGTVFAPVANPNPTPTGTEPAPGTTPFPTATKPPQPTSPAPTLTTSWPTQPARNTASRSAFHRSDFS